MNPNQQMPTSNAPSPQPSQPPTDTSQDPMAQVSQTIDQLIKAGGASVEDLQNLQMDIQDCMSGGQSEPSEPSSGMAGMISKAQGGGY